MNWKSLLAGTAASRHPGVAAGFLGLLLVLVTGLYWWHITDSAERLRAETLHQGDLRGQQLVHATANQVALLFRSVDVSARELAGIYEPGDARGLDREVKKIESRLPPGSLLQVGIVGTDGYLLYSNLGLRERAYLGDREHIKVQLNGSEDRLFISKPLLGRVSKQWTIQFTRPILRAGRVVGVVVISVSPAYLKDGLAAITLGSNDSIAIFRQSGEYLARNLDHESSLGRQAPADRPFVGDAAPATGQLRIVSNFDRTPRLYRWQRLADYPITVVLGLSERTLLAPAERVIAIDWRNGLIGTIALWSLGLAAAFLFGSLVRQQRLVVERSEQLRASRQLLDSIVENIPTMIFLKRASDLRFELFNRAGEDLIGMKRDQLLGRNDHDLFPRDQADFFTSKDRTVLSGSGMVDIAEEPIQTLRGPRVLHTKKVALHDERGEPSHLLGISEDITERKQAEAELREAKEQLERRVAERTMQLEAANKELADFSYSVSHDLRSPLRAVAGFARILEDDCGAALGDEGRRLVRAIQDAGVRMGRLVDGLLDYLGLSRKTLQVAPLDMRLLAAEAYGQVAPPADRKLTFDLGELPPALGDASLVREVFAKLLSNAIRFSASKGDPRIEVGASRGAGENTYFVRDNGIGFDMQYAVKLFCVFERLHSEPELTGTGVGLAMVKRIVERHGGRVRAEGKVGEGATFYFSLPSCPV
ncbi:MAG TPA: ATP-binding protein [Rhodocyclaceae bacterium]